MKEPKYAGKVDAGSLQPSEPTDQQRLEMLEQFADIFACIFGDLTPEEHAKYMSVDMNVKAA